jgi:hypothetical protein
LIGSWKLIGIGLVLVILGVVGPLLMVMGMVAPTFWLGGFSYFASTIGLMLGLLGAAFYARERVKGDYWE